MSNDFLPFATGSGANVLSQAAYAALAALGPGFASGVAQSAACNKAWRQSSIMSAVVAQLIVDNTGQNATDDGTTATLLANLKTAVSGRLINVQTFSTPGTSTYTPTPGTKSVVVEVQGAGAGSGGVAATTSGQVAASGAGGSGAYAKARFTSGFSGVLVTVGAGGTGGAAGTNGGNPGGTSSFGALISAPGGSPGGSLAPGTIIPIGRGGSTNSSAPAGGNIVQFPGAPGGGSLMVSASTGSVAIGASSTFGPGGLGSQGNGVSPITAPGFGCGAGGITQIQSSAAAAGAAGAPGIVTVWELG